MDSTPQKNTEFSQRSFQIDEYLVNEQNTENTNHMHTINNYDRSASTLGDEQTLNNSLAKNQSNNLKKKSTKNTQNFKNQIPSNNVFDFEEFNAETLTNFDQNNDDGQNNDFDDDENFNENESDLDENENVSLSNNNHVNKSSLVDGSILRKRNSNQKIDAQNLSGDENDTLKSSTSKMIISNKNRLSNLANNSNNSNKYSCSLPREIPCMSLNPSRSTRNNSSSKQEDAENYDSKTKRQKQQSVTNRNFVEDILDEIEANENGEEDEDEVYSQERGFEFEEGADLGQAISNLASSIVAKDGRELFGGVPSRRIPINSISQSYF